MNRLTIIIVALLFIAGCATNGQIVKSNTPYYTPYYENQIPLNKTEEPVKKSKVEMPKKVNTISTPSKDNTAPVKNKEQNIDDEDEVALLLEHDTFQDFDIPIVFNDAVKYYIGYFTTEKRKVFGNWLRRARYYVPIIKEILKEHGMPEDLAYLAMIESGFNPKAYSSAKACGPWQFIYSTGGRYGLKVNYWIDERRDPEKSTVAAAKYLKDLFNQFGCWYLAAAGYNAGENRVAKAIEKHNTNDFWELAKYNALPRETREYIPKLIAAAIIAKDPEKFGFGSIKYDDPIRFVEIKVPSATSLPAIAKANSMDLSELKSYNPEVLRGITPPKMDGYVVKLPSPVDVDEFNKNLEIALIREKKIRDIVAYKVKKKDTLAKILKRYRLKQEDIYLVNDCEEGLKLKPGMVLNIPSFSTPSKTKTAVAKNVKKESHEVETASLVKPEKPDKPDKPDKPEQYTTKTYHIVKKGETLSTISSKYRIDVASIKSANKLRSDKLYPNMKLKLVSHVQKKDNVKVTYHIVKKGETLSTISSKYRIDVASIKSANKLKTSKVYPRMKLKIVVEG
jgi:membrane-bound lytic murein transglycosylase D